jgi:SAM-dependent methyltransferase
MIPDQRTLGPYASRIGFFLKGLRGSPKLEEGAAVLFVGCGTCEELIALHLANETSYLVGIDLRAARLPVPIASVDLLCADAEHTPFRNSCFDFCYTFHSLEHMKSAERCVSEMARVMRDDGELFLSTPNKKRLIAYLCSAQRETLNTILMRNLREWTARLRGVFESRLGYHCGFTMAELHSLLVRSFKEVRFVSRDYTMHVAGTKYRPMVRLVDFFGVLGAVCPSHAVFCTYPRRGQSRQL